MLCTFLRVCDSVQKWVLQSIFVPDTIFVEYEELLSLSISEDHFAIKAVDIPDQGTVHHACIDFLKCINVDIDPSDVSEDTRLVEYNLLSVRKQLCMECKVLHSCKLSRQ